MRILFGWELGAGRGHLAPHLGVLRALSAAGHDVTVVAKDVARAHEALGKLSFRSLQAPVWQRRPNPSDTPSFAHVLFNAGLAVDGALTPRLRAWDAIVDLTEPDLVLTDYSPTLLLALRSRDVPTVNLGTGFCNPPPVKSSTFWPLRQHPAAASEPSVQTAIVHAANRALDERQAPLLTQLSDLFHEGPRVYVSSFPELDHYAERPAGHYVGVSPSAGTFAPRWPGGSGPRVFCYLKPSPAVSRLLSELERRKWPTLVVGDGLGALLSEQRGPHVRSAPPHLNLEEVAKQCDVCISNANHATCAQMLFHGVPHLVLPLSAEQIVVAASIVREGWGIAIDPCTGGGLNEALDRLVSVPGFRTAVAHFAERRKVLHPSGYVDRVLRLLSVDAPGVPPPSVSGGSSVPGGPRNSTSV